MIRCILVLALLLAAAVPLAQSQPALPRGTTAEEVRRTLGPPERVSRLIFFRRHIEQWHYADPPRLVELNFRRGEEPEVIRIVNERK